MEFNWDDIFTWLHAFVGWLRGRVSVEETPSPWIERHISEDGECELQLLQDENSGEFPGVAALWLVSHQAAANDLILILINIAQAREMLAKQVAIGLDERAMIRRTFEVKAKKALEDQREILGTHLIMTGWITKEAVRSRTVNGQEEHYRHLDAGVCHSVNLTDALSHYHGENYYATRIMRAIAFQLLHMRPRNYTWEQIVRSLDAGDGLNTTSWLTWLKYYATESTTTRLSDRSHVLQPPRKVT